MACRHLIFRIALLLMLAGCWSAQASDRFRVGGFGTLGYAWDDRNDIAAYRDISQLPKDGYATGPSWLLDSRLGMQLEYNLTPIINLVGQIVWRDHFKASLSSSTELAYVAVHPHPDVDVRVGRINYDAFLMSDHRNVGYAYPWVRPPLEFYGWIPIFSIDGADVAYRMHSANDTSWRIKAQAGNSQFWIPVNSGIGGGYRFETNDLMSLSLTHQSELWRVKLAHSRFSAATEVPAFGPLHAGLDAVAAAAIPGVSTEAADLRKNLSFKGAHISYTTLGFAYDDNTWLAQAELGLSSSTADVVPTSRMAYASVGRRFGDWLPFVMLSTSRPVQPRSARNNWGGLNATVRDPAVRTANALRIDQNTLSIGARWDFHAQAALKLQWDHSRSNPPGYGVWMRAVDASRRSERLNLFTATVDFVF